MKYQYKKATRKQVEATLNLYKKIYETNRKNIQEVIFSNKRNQVSLFYWLMTWMDLEEKYLSKGAHLDEQLRQNSFRRIRSIKTIHALHSALEI